VQIITIEIQGPSDEPSQVPYFLFTSTRLKCLPIRSHLN
jgi:hypothetical protein